MDLHRIESPGLAHQSYVLADGRDAIVIDPRRDVDAYLRLAAERGYRIRTVLETHRNEDYVIGSTALARATGADVLHSGRLDFGYGAAARDGDELRLGRLLVRVIETPGHTDDSLCFSVSDRGAPDAAFAVFTGDTLLFGDTGRTDLYGDAERERLAAELHASLYDRLLPLGDGVVVCPGHGAGSVCGGAIEDRPVSTLGYERLNNPAIARDRDAFIAMKAAERHVRPPYFERMEEWNLRGTAPVYERVPVPPPLTAGELAERMQDGTPVIDARMPPAFAGGHIPGSYNLWRAGLSTYLSWVVAPGRPFALVLPDGADVEAVARELLRIGYDEVEGYLHGGFDAWQDDGRPLATLGTLDTDAVRERWRRGELDILDVRTPAELRAGGIEGATRIFVGELERRLDEVPRDRPVAVMCSVGHRAGLGASILARHGRDDVYNYLGGFTAWRHRRA